MDIQSPLPNLNPSQPQDSSEQPAIIAAIKQPFEKKTKLEVWKIAVVTALGLALVAGLAIFLWNRYQATLYPAVDFDEQPTPTPEVAQAWLIYSNSKHNFTIEYPADWVLTESPSGEGASFKPQNSQNMPGVSDDITLYVGQKTLTEDELTFEDYAKVAAVKEIQNYNSLASFEPITLVDGTVGYKTTWMIQSIANHQDPESESAPITYFQAPGSDTLLLRVSSGYDVDSAVYDWMIKSVVFASPTGFITSVTPNQVQTSTPTPVATSTPTSNEEETLKTTIKQQILADSTGDGGTLTVSVSKISGDYAQGLASDEGSGGMWFAAKVNGAWKLVWDGNGTIFCSDLTDYPDFPTSMIPECYDQATESSVKR